MDEAITLQKARFHFTEKKRSVPKKRLGLEKIAVQIRFCAA
jgi:hypothetical protein